MARPAARRAPTAPPGPSLPRLDAPEPGPWRLRLDARTLVIAERDPGFWWRAAAEGRWTALVPESLTGSGLAHVARRLADPRDRLTLKALRRIAVETAPRIYGMPWWAARHLAGTVAANWLDHATWCVRTGCDPDAEDLPRRLAVAFAWLLAGCRENEDVSRLLASVFDPPPGDEAETLPGWEPSAQAAAFARFAGSSLTPPTTGPNQEQPGTAG